MFALLIDIALSSFLCLATFIGFSWGVDQTLGSKGLGFGMNTEIFTLIPVFIIYLIYFSPEATSGSSFGRKIIGLEVRRENGESSKNQKWMTRFLFKHLGVLTLGISILFNSSLLQMLGGIWSALYVVSSLGNLGPKRQTLIERFLNMATYPAQTPKSDLFKLKGQGSLKEAAVEIAKATRDQGNRLSPSGKERAKLRPESFPCAVELRVYARPGKQNQDLANEFLECFTRFIPHIHENQIQECPPKGKYSVYKMIMRFDQHKQMEASYTALSEHPNVVTTITVKSVKVEDAGKGKRRSLKTATS
jgi:putative lipoic acid-binding regulatory protein